MDGPDFDRYFKFIEFNFNVSKKLSSEQGFVYYDLHSIYFFLKDYPLSEANFFIYIHKNIQEVNFILLLIGFAGFYKLLKFLNYDSNTIFFTLLIVSIFPITISQILVLKPEIYSFSVFPWIIYSMELFKKSGKLKYIFFAVPLTVGAISTKGSIFAMLILCLLLFYGKDLFVYLPKKDPKSFIIVTLFFLILLFSIFIENNEFNDRSLFDLASGEYYEEKYNNKAPLSIFYKLDISELIYYPYKHNHSSSAFSILLLDTFGDYFDLYWNNDASQFFKNRKELLIVEQSSAYKFPEINLEKGVIKIFSEDIFEIYPRRLLGLLFSAVIYFQLLKQIFNKKRNKKFLFLPFLGILILGVHVTTGIPSNNFDINTGDTLKPLYFSFFLITSFIFVLANLIDKKRLRKFFVILIIPFLIYLYGFPKNYDDDNFIYLYKLNSYTELCNINSYLLNFELSNLDFECDKNSQPEMSEFKRYPEYKHFLKLPIIKKVNITITLLSLISILCLMFPNLRIKHFFAFGRNKKY